jgi:hypothetical protein
MLDGVAGLSSFSEEYNKKLRSGLAWDLQFEFRVSRFTCGLSFLNYISRAATDYTSDKIAIRSIIPQIGLYFVTPQQSRIAIKMLIGGGPVIYNNNSRVFGNKRKAYRTTMAGMVGISGIYRLSSHIGLSAEARYTDGESFQFHVDYHENSFKVRQRLPLAQVSISAGVNYIF